MNKYRIIIISLLVFLFGLTAGVCIEEFVSGKNIDNISNSAQAKETNVNTGNAVKSNTDEIQLPSVLLFHSKNCSSCEKIRPVWKALQKEYKKDFRFIEIDVDIAQNAPLCMEFLITTIPSIYIEDVPFRNRAYINPVMYGYLPRFSDELSRYLDLRKILKKGYEAEN